MTTTLETKTELPYPFTIAQAKENNRSAGQHWFEPDTMRFFNSRIGRRMYGRRMYGRYFVSSEQGPDGIRRYSIRQSMPNGHIETVGTFGQFSTSASATRAAKSLRVK